MSLPGRGCSQHRRTSSSMTWTRPVRQQRQPPVSCGSNAGANAAPGASPYPRRSLRCVCDTRPPPRPAALARGAASQQGWRSDRAATRAGTQRGRRRAFSICRRCAPQRAPRHRCGSAVCARDRRLLNSPSPLPAAGTRWSRLETSSPQACPLGPGARARSARSSSRTYWPEARRRPRGRRPQARQRWRMPSRRPSGARRGSSARWGSPRIR